MVSSATHGEIVTTQCRKDLNNKPSTIALAKSKSQSMTLIDTICSGGVAEGLFLLPFVRPMGKMLDWRSVASSPSRWGVWVEAKGWRTKFDKRSIG